MSLLEWSQEYSVGIEAVDLQHKRIFEILNKLHDCTGTRKEKECIEQAFTDLYAYILVHFKSEETIMEEHNVPFFTHHRKLHENLKVQVTTYREKVNKGDPVSAAEVSGFIINWLTDHIKKEDARLREYTP